MKKFTVIALALLCTFVIIGCDLGSLTSSTSDQASTSGTQTDSLTDGDLTTDSSTTSSSGEIPTPTTTSTTAANTNNDTAVKSHLMSRMAAVEERLSEATVIRSSSYSHVLINNEAEDEAFLDMEYESAFLVDYANLYMEERFSVGEAATDFLICQNDGVLFMHTLVGEIVVSSEVLADPAEASVFSETIDSLGGIVEPLPLPEIDRYGQISDEEFMITFALSDILEDPAFAEWIAPVSTYDMEVAATILVTMSITISEDLSYLNMNLNIQNVDYFGMDGYTINLSATTTLSFPSSYVPKEVVPYIPE